MKRHLPPLPALRAFEAAARLMSFRRAASELGLTPSAISHQVKTLESFVGVALFERVPDGLTLTSSGAAYLEELAPILDALDASTRRIADADGGDTLRVLSTPGFAARWLVPRLHRFEWRDRIEIKVSQGAPSTDFSSNGADVVIHWRDAPVEGVRVEPMMQSGRYPVAHADFVARERLHEPRDLHRVTLLHDEVLDAWDVWFRLANTGLPQLPRGPRLAHCELTLTAAEQCQGVALAYDAMARSTIAEGRLVRLFDIATPPIVIYSFAYPESRRRCQSIKILRDWMIEEVAAEGSLSAASVREAAE